jgi:hypothetical protein
MKGSISGSIVSHSSPRRSVRLRWHRTAASLVAGDSERISLRMPELTARWWSCDATTDARAVIAVVAWDVPRLPIGRLSCARSGSATALKLVGDCQNSMPRLDLG